MTEREDKYYQVCVREWVIRILTPCEQHLLQCLLAGSSMAVIAKTRGRSIKTVSCQKRNLYEKLGIKSDLQFYKNLLENNAITLVPKVKI
ncbi:helix-turn-helix transcriptional regulator [Enterobacter ludwigii]|uniref:helix-turn-helix transcriptional regulator n=1 Tax=Enterobacter ludwigii TaxID=299767 RepID=UPI003F5B210E